MTISPYRRSIPNIGKKALALIMAGGRGTRLGELTRRHAKPALPFAAQYRNIDFPLSNCVNSGVTRIGVLTQYKAHSLIRHIRHGWNFIRPETGGFVEPWPSQQRQGSGWYSGTANAVYQNIDLIEAHKPSYVIVLAGDHIYRMDYAAMIEAHVASAAQATVGCIEVPIAAAGAFGVMQIDPAGWVQSFAEKPREPKPLPGNPHSALGSMGIYVFNRTFLRELLEADAAGAQSRHDFGHDILPSVLEAGRLLAYSFRDPQTGRPAYWRDVGTLDSYWQANMDLLSDQPPLDLHDDSWPIFTHRAPSAPVRFCAEGMARGSIIGAGSTVSGVVRRSLISTSCEVGRGARIEHCLVLPNARIGRNCRLNKVIVDGGCIVPDDTVVGESPEEDARFHQVSDAGVTLVTATGLARAAAGAEPRKVA